MGQIQTTTATKLPEGAKIVTSKAISPVMVTRIRTVGLDKQTLELQLEQLFERPINGQSGVLSLTMAGHSAFNTGPRKRITWQNFSIQQAIAQGIVRSWDEVANSVQETPDGVLKGVMVIPNGRELILTVDGSRLPLKLIDVETFEPRPPYKDRVTGELRTQQPKTAGNGGDLLLYNDKKIYRNTGLSFPGAGDLLTGREWDQDVVILHNNQGVVGSAVRGAMQKTGIKVPTLPGSPAHTRVPDDQQNRGIGNTHNLTSAVPEPTRKNPDEQLQDVSEKTQAEMQREEGERALTGDGRQS